MPEATETNTSVWLVLLPVIVGGIIGLAGGLIGPPFVHHLQTKAEKKKRRAEKFEELVAALFEHQHWLQTMRNVRLFNAEDKNVVSPMAKVQAISSVYFPEFDAQIRELDLAGDNYELWMMNAQQKRIKEDDKFAEGAVEAYQAYFKKLLSLLQELKTFAGREFQ